MSTLKRLTATILALASMALCLAVTVNPAPAADLGGKKSATRAEVEAAYPVDKPAASWSGVYLGGYAGYGAADMALSNSFFGLDGLSGTGRLGGVTAGADWQIPSSFLVTGGRCSYQWSDETFAAHIGTTGLKASLDDGWSCDGRLGAALGSAMPYLFVGYTVTHTSASFGTTALNAPDLRGWRYGGGVEFRLPKIDTGAALTPTLALEGVYTDFDSKTFGSTKMDVTDVAVLARLNLRFNPR